MINSSAIVGQNAVATAAPVPDNGLVDTGSAKWIADNPALVKLSPTPNGLGCGIEALAAGTVNISWQATSFGNPISGTEVIQIAITVPPPPAATGALLSITPFA